MNGVCRDHMMENNAVQLILTLLAAFAVGVVFRRIGVPGGMMLGGIIGAAALNILTAHAYAPSFIRFIAQSIAGGFLGSSLKRSDVKKMPRLIGPLLIVIAGMSVSNILIGYIITRVSPLDSVTALASGIAGGINDTPLIAADLGADAGKVAVLQFVRLLTGIGLFPLLIRSIEKTEPKTEGKDAADGGGEPPARPANRIIVITLAVALLGGSIGKWIGIPAGALLFSTIACAALQLGTGTAHMPPVMKQVAQLFTGAFIGCLMEQSDLLELKYLVLPALALIVVFLLNCFASSFLIRRVSRFTRKESMLATTPAGASEIALISSDMNVELAEATDIMLLHIIRVIAAVSIMPQIIPYIARLL